MLKQSTKDNPQREATSGLGSEDSVGDGVPAMIFSVQGFQFVYKVGGSG